MPILTPKERRKPESQSWYFSMSDQFKINAQHLDWAFVPSFPSFLAKIDFGFYLGSNRMGKLFCTKKKCLMKCFRIKVTFETHLFMQLSIEVQGKVANIWQAIVWQPKSALAAHFHGKCIEYAAHRWLFDPLNPFFQRCLWETIMLLQILLIQNFVDIGHIYMRASFIHLYIS